jgi:hypothetical protein
VTPFDASCWFSKIPRWCIVSTCSLVVGALFAGLAIAFAGPAAGAPVPTTASATTSTTLFHRTTSSTAPRERVNIPSLHDGASVPPRAVVSLNMFTPELGVALALMPPSTFGTGRYYIVRTDDGGTAWTVSGTLPRRLIPSDQLRVSIAFATPAEGYLNSYINGSPGFSGDRVIGSSGD